ncbi:purine-cytosine permease family protein [Monashia sp. NPDC004114]
MTTTEWTQERTAPDTSLEIESHGIDVIPESERRGRPRQLFAVWAAANVNFLGFIVGTVLILMGLSVWQALGVIVVGNLFAVFTGIVAGSGPAAGTPSEVITRAMFGVTGNRVNVAIAGWLVSVCYLALNWVAAAYVAFSLVERIGIPVTTPVEVAIIVLIAGVTLVISVYGHGFILRFYQPLAIVLAVVFAVMAVFVISGANWGFTPAAPLQGTDLWAAVAAGTALVASGPLSYTNSADFARYLPSTTRVRDVALWTALGSMVPGIIISSVGALAATAADASDARAAAESLLPGWFTPVFLVAVIVGTIANNAMTAYSSGLALQSIGVRLPRSRSVLLDGAVGTAMTLYALLVWNFLDSVSNAMQLVVTVLAPVMAVYTADMWWRRNRYDGRALSDQSKASRFWYTNGVNVAGATALLVGVALALMCASTPVFTGPIAGALGNVDLSLVVGLVVPGVLYLLLMSTYAAPRESR